MKFKNKGNGKTYRWLAQGTLEESGVPDTDVAIYCPDDNEHTVYCREIEEFYNLFELVENDNKKTI